MNHYNKYQVEDFVQDLRFRAWVLGRSPADNLQWEEWLRQYPEKQAIVEEAKSLVVATQIEKINISEQDIQTGIQAILKRTESKQVFLKKRKWLKMSAIAACLCVLLAAGWILFFDGNKEKTTNSLSITSNDNAIKNKSEKPFSMQLSDGTTVTLKGESQLNVAPDFGQKNRTVYLIGEAFFEVKKDAQRPFIVIGGGIVTKVLGTSFNVRAYQGEAKTLVTVKTGKVTVYQEEKISKKGSKTVKTAQILLTPNQQVIFEREKEKLVKTLVEKPILLDTQATKNQFVFEETPISKVFGLLEKSYGIKMVYDSELLADCNLTAVFEQETLYEKIDIICETIQATYEIADGQIVIYAKGCK